MAYKIMDEGMQVTKEEMPRLILIPFQKKRSAGKEINLWGELKEVAE